MRRIHDFIRNMVSAIANVSLYAPDHRQVHRLCSKAHENLLNAMGLVVVLIANKFVNKLDVQGIL